MFEAESVLLDADATDGERQAVAAVLGSRGVEAPVRAGWTLPPETGDSITFWVTIVTLGAGWSIGRFVSSFLGGFGQRLGEHVADLAVGLPAGGQAATYADELIGLIRDLYRARDGASLGPEGVLEIQDADGARIHLVDDLPPEAFKALAGVVWTGRRAGVLRWYDDEGWVWIETDE